MDRTFAGLSQRERLNLAPWQVGDGLFEAFGGAVLLGGPGHAVPADLVHLARELDGVAIRIPDLKAHVASRPASAFELELDPLLLKKVSSLEEVLDALYFQGDVMKGQVSVFWR